MGHQNILKGENVGFPQFISEISTELLDSLKKNRPYPERVKRLILLCQLCSVVRNILEHADSGKVIIDVLAIIAGVFVNCVKYCDEIVLTQFVNVMIDNKFQAFKARCDDLIIFYELWSFADSEDYQSPAIVFELLPASLNDAFDTLKRLELIICMRGFELIREWCQHCVLPY